MSDTVFAILLVTWLTLAWVSIVALIVWVKRVRASRLVLAPGTVVEFYDTTRTILRARLVLTRFEQQFNGPTRAELEDLSNYIERNTIRERA